MRQTLSICTLLTLVLVFSVDYASGAEPPKEFTNSIGMKFKLIPGGEFMMGSSKSPEELAKAFPPTSFRSSRGDDPQHKVRITKPFYLGVTEVTQEQYEKVMGKNPSFFSKTGRGAGRFKGTDTSNSPVEQVSWGDAVEFCKKLSVMEGHTYRLPTEAEWEYACRAGGTTVFCFGDDERQLAEYAWFAKNSDRNTHPVGTKKPNAWGLFDMHGSVWEWCQDRYGENYYAKLPTDDPTGPAFGSARVFRGGGWLITAWDCRSSSRDGVSPSARNDSLGFRVARGPSSK